MSAGNTTKRILVSIVSIPVVLAAAYFGRIYFLLFGIAIALVSFYEFALMAKHKGAEINKWIGLAAVAVLVANQYWIFMDTYLFLLILILLLTLTELFRNSGSAIVNTGTALLGIFYFGLFAGSLIGIREFYPGGGDAYLRGGYIIISILISIWVCDSAAFFGGTALGKHKLFPRVSPNKSWEGAIFGFVFAVITMIIVKPILLDFFSWNTVIVFGVIVGTIGQSGDLVESLLKRDAGVKDSSHLIPGHGGIFDRFDSLLYTAPVILIYMKYLGR